MEQLYIFGCSGFAVECSQLALRTGQYKIAAFIDKDDCVTENSTVTISTNLKVPIISESSFYNDTKSSENKKHCIIAIANSLISKRIFEKFIDYCYFPNLVDPSAQLNELKSIGMGNLIFQYVILSWNVELGNFNKFLSDTHVGHESTIGNFNEFNSKVSISGKCSVGDGNLFGVGCMIYQGKKVGDSNVIGMGSVLLRNVKSNETWFGNPAKKIEF